MAMNGTHANGMLPGTTFPEKNSLASTACGTATSKPQSSPGPVINGKKTTITLYEPQQLPGLPVMQDLKELINDSFRWSHIKHGHMPASIDRLRSVEDYLAQLGIDPGTFVYILTWSDSGEPIATAGAHRYVAPTVEAEPAGAFRRVRLPAGAEGAEVWELKIMAVGVNLQGQGLASYLMGLMDDEVQRREREGIEDGAYRTLGRKVFMVLTTVKEALEEFYRRRGYEVDYETVHPEGEMGSETGFTVLHMSKILEP